jgi:WD40 repeat protein
MLLAALALLPPRPACAEPPGTDPDGNPLPPGAVARLGTRRLWQPYPARSLVFSRDGKSVIAADAPPVGKEERWIRIWDATTGRLRRSLAVHPQAGEELALSPSGRVLAQAGLNRIWLLDLTTGRVLREFGTGQGGWLANIAFSPDGKVLASIGTSGLALWDPDTGKLLRRLAGPGPGWSLAWSPDGHSLAAGWDGALDLWDARTGTRLWQVKAAQTRFSSLAFSPDGKTVSACVGWDQIRVLDAADGKELRRWEIEEAGRPVAALAPGGEILALGHGERVIHLWDPRTGKEVGTLNGVPLQVWSLVFSPDGRTLAAGAGYSIQLWDMTTRQPVVALEGHRSAVAALAFDPGGSVLISGGDDGALLWDLRRRRTIRRPGWEDARAWAVALGPGGRTLAAAGGGRAWLWEVATGKELRRFRVAEWDHGMEPVAVATGGAAVACRDNEGHIGTWDTATSRRLRQFGGSDDAPRSSIGGFCTLSPDGALLAVGASGKPTGLWHMADGKLVRRLDGDDHESACFSPDGKMLALGGKGITLWQLPDGPALQELTCWQGTIRSLAFSPDGRSLASAGEDGTICLWEVAGGGLRRQFSGHGFPLCSLSIYGLAFSPDGRTLASGGQDPTILLWDLVGPDPAPKPALKDLTDAWQRLEDPDAGRAYAGLCRMAADPGPAAAFLRRHLRPLRRPDPARLARLVAELDSDVFAVRERATQELAALGEAAAPALEQVLRGRASAEARHRASQLLADTRPSAMPPARWRALRAVEVLERIGTAEAREVLTALAAGAPGARLTEEARGSLQRLERRSASKP